MGTFFSPSGQQNLQRWAQSFQESKRKIYCFSSLCYWHIWSHLPPPLEAPRWYNFVFVGLHRIQGNCCVFSCLGKDDGKQWYHEPAVPPPLSLFPLCSLTFYVSCLFTVSLVVLQFVSFMHDTFVPDYSLVIVYDCFYKFIPILYICSSSQVVFYKRIQPQLALRLPSVLCLPTWQLSFPLRAARSIFKDPSTPITWLFTTSYF